MTVRNKLTDKLLANQREPEDFMGANGLLKQAHPAE